MLSFAAMGWGFNIARRVCLAGLIGMILGCAATEAAEPKRVMVLHSFGRDFRPWNDYSRILRTELERQSPGRLDITDHSLVTARSNDDDPEAPFVEYLRALHAKKPLDLIVSVGSPAAAFVQRHRASLFTSTAIVFTAIEERLAPLSAVTANDAIVAMRIDIPDAVKNILQVLPDTRNVVMIVGTSPVEKYWREEIGREIKPLADRVTFLWTDPLSFEEILKHAAALPPKTAIFWALMIVDAAGVGHQGNTAQARLHAVANAPVFSYEDAFFGAEIVGGPLLSVEDLARQAAAIAGRILGGEKAGDIKVPLVTSGAPKFDWRQMHRWGISESRLPPGSQIHFRPPTMWEQYHWQIVAIVAALLLQAGLIAWLIYEHRRRSLAEVQSRNAMAELARMNRLATAGQLSASIAHEINQPVTGIVLKASAALRWLAVERPDADKIRSLLTEIVGAGQRAGDIIHSVRAMFTKEENAKAAINLNNLVNTVLALLRVDLQKDGVRVETQLDEGLPAVNADAVQLQQVILNLIVNAADAMRAAQTRVLTIQSGRSASGLVRVSVEDSGSGVDHADRDRIFNPLFTTKAGGMGMGLSICRSIIENHGGRIWVSSAARRGAVFQFELPVAEGRAGSRNLAA
jgi:signal transduction histidine kinase